MPKEKTVWLMYFARRDIRSWNKKLQPPKCRETCCHAKGNGKENAGDFSKRPYPKRRNTTRVADILSRLASLKWRWAGHLARSNDERWTKKVVLWRVAPEEDPPPAGQTIYLFIYLFFLNNNEVNYRKEKKTKLLLNNCTIKWWMTLFW